MNRQERRGPDDEDYEDDDSKGKKFEGDIDGLYNPKK